MAQAAALDSELAHGFGAVGARRGHVRVRCSCRSASSSVADTQCRAQAVQGSRRGSPRRPRPAPAGLRPSRSAGRRPGSARLPAVPPAPAGGTPRRPRPAAWLPAPATIGQPGDPGGRAERSRPACRRSGPAGRRRRARSCAGPRSAPRHRRSCAGVSARGGQSAAATRAPLRRPFRQRPFGFLRGGRGSRRAPPLPGGLSVSVVRWAARLRSASTRRSASASSAPSSARSRRRDVHCRGQPAAQRRQQGCLEVVRVGGRGIAGGAAGNARFPEHAGSRAGWRCRRRCRRRRARSPAASPRVVGHGAPRPSTVASAAFARSVSRSARRPRSAAASATSLPWAISASAIASASRIARSSARRPRGERGGGVAAAGRAWQARVGSKGRRGGRGRLSRAPGGGSVAVRSSAARRVCSASMAGRKRVHGPAGAARARVSAVLSALPAASSLASDGAAVVAERGFRQRAVGDGAEGLPQCDLGIAQLAPGGLQAQRPGHRRHATAWRGRRSRRRRPGPAAPSSSASVAARSAHRRRPGVPAAAAASAASFGCCCRRRCASLTTGGGRQRQCGVASPGRAAMRRPLPDRIASSRCDPRAGRPRPRRPRPRSSASAVDVGFGRDPGRVERSASRAPARAVCSSVRGGAAAALVDATPASSASRQRFSKPSSSSGASLALAEHSVGGLLQTLEPGAAGADGAQPVAFAGIVGLLAQQGFQVLRGLRRLAFQRGPAVRAQRRRRAGRAPALLPAGQGAPDRAGFVAGGGLAEFVALALQLRQQVAHPAMPPPAANST